MTSEQNKLSDVDLAARLTSLNPWADMDWPEVCKAAADALSRRASAGGEAVAWEGYWSGAGSISSTTKLTKFASTAEQWRDDGAEVTPLYAALHFKALPDVSEEMPCPRCDGLGYWLHGSAGEVDCPSCNGTGKIAALNDAHGGE